MTSKNCCFKLMKEDAKRRLWLIALLALLFVFLYPVAVTSMLGDYVSNSIDPENAWIRLINSLTKYFSVNNGMILFVVIVSSVICGISSFSYLCSKKQVDFYHAIPVKREVLFLAQYINGILIFVLLFGISVFTSLLIAAVNGALTLTLFHQAVTTLLIQSSFYILLYSTVVAAVMMTGNIIITLLGTGIFFFYGPAVFALINGYFSIWFETFYSTGFWLTGFKFTSPFAFYIASIEMILEGKLFTVVAAALLAALVITLLSVWMYKKRPSEAAGKAMAFEKTKTVIKILLVIPFSMAGCIFFWGIHYRIGWSLFGLLVGGILSHCVIEIIYAFDFRRLFAHKLHMLVCLLASILLFLGFKCDITGFDKYIPVKENLQSVAISIYGLDEWVTYGTPNTTQKHYYWNYQDSTEYIFEHMDMKQTEPVLEVIRTAMAGGQSVAERDYNDGIYSNYSHWINVRYTLKSGRKVYRSVNLPGSEFAKVAAVYSDPEYKEGVFPIMKQNAGDTAAVAYQEMSHITMVPLNTKEEIGELLNAYKEELRGLTFETKKSEQPIGMIQFRTLELDKAINQEEGSYSDLDQRTYYPVYPSFTKTIQLLEAAGIDPGTKLKVDKITKITFEDSYYSEDYTRNSAMAEPVVPVEKIADTGTADTEGVTISTDENGNKTYIVTGRKTIEQLYSCVVPRDYADLNPISPYDQYMNVTVEYGEGLDKYAYQFVVIPERLPDEYIKMFGYDKKDMR